MESGQEQFLDHQVKLLITNVVANREPKVILVVMNQGICSINRVSLANKVKACVMCSLCRTMKQPSEEQAAVL